jgi:uncharacterized protein
VRDLAGSLIRVDVSADQSSATLSLLPGIDPTELSETLVLAIVGERCLLSRDVRARVSSLTAAYLIDPSREHAAVVAQGTPVIHGQDGRVELDPAFDPLARDPRHTSVDDTDPRGEVEDPEYEVDHYKSSLKVLPAGTIVGRLIAPIPGTDGSDITGRVMAAREARPALLSPDDTIRVHADGSIEAVVAGMLDTELPRLRVLRQIDIPGNIDFNTGNVDFAGDVNVARGVKDCFAVNATGRVRVRDLVEAATISAGLDAELAGGMAAREKGAVTVGRDLCARYLDNVRALIGRDLTVDREIINCHVTVGRRVRMATGAITGGLLMAADSVEVQQLGSANATPTRISLGRLAKLERLLQDAHAILESIGHRKARVEQKLAQLKAAATRPTPAQAEELTELSYTKSGLDARASQLIRQIDLTRATIRAHARAELTVHGRLCAGVTLFIGRYVCESLRDIKGPIRIFVPLSEDPTVLPTDAEPRCTDLIAQRTFPLIEVMRVHKHDRYQGPDEQRPPLAKAA